MSADAQTVLLIGLDGYGRQHLKNLQRLAERGTARLVAGVSLSDPGPEVRGDIPVYRTLAEVQQAGHQPDVVIVSTPISTHFELALSAVQMGADVLLEKPPTATLDQHRRLCAAAEEAGRLVQVGFQSLGSHALETIEALFDGVWAPPGLGSGAGAGPSGTGAEASEDRQPEAGSRPGSGLPEHRRSEGSTLGRGTLGALRAVGATGLWLRTESYYQRARWAGRRVLDGQQVVDGVVTNPLAHAVATALRIAGAAAEEDLDQLECELHHAHQIEADDTSLVRIRTASGIPVTAALTLCAPEQQDPWVSIYGTEGYAEFFYTRDELVVHPNGQSQQRLSFGRTDLLENLLQVRRGEAERLLSPLEGHGPFMHVLEAVRTADDPRPIPAELLQFAGDGGERHPIVPGIERFAARAVKAPSSFSSLGAPWAAEPELEGSLSVRTQGRSVPVADLRSGADISPTDSPRPFLDAVRTLGEVIVSDQQPEDHTWHLGVGVALQDVSGNNFWGGRTYTREAGRYVWRRDHGRILATGTQIEEHDGGQLLRQQLDWIAASGSAVLREQREVRVTAGGEEGWSMDFSFALTPAADQPVSLGSPGSNGRIGGGYGGFFWRLPHLEDALILTAEAEGEDGVHGTVTDWLAISAEFAPLPHRRGHGGPATVLLLRGAGEGPGASGSCGDPGSFGDQPPAPNPDPWFVRHSGYPGAGMSLAWDTALELAPGQQVRRSLRAVVLDGRRTVQELVRLADSLL